MTQWKPLGAHWWLGLTDMLASGVGHGAQKLERVHLAVADETFYVLDRVPVVRTFSRLVRFSHHGISRISYGSVSLTARAVSNLNQNLGLLVEPALNASDSHIQGSNNLVSEMR